MNRRRMAFLLALTAVVVLASLGWLLPMSKTSQAAPAPAADAAFKGKFLLVYTEGGYMPTIFILEKAQVQKIGDRSCLVGTGAADGRLFGWNKGRTVLLPMEKIVSITEFDGVKDAKKALESSRTMASGVSSYLPPVGPTPIAEPIKTLPKNNCE